MSSLAQKDTSAVLRTHGTEYLQTEANHKAGMKWNHLLSYSPLLSAHAEEVSKQNLLDQVSALDTQDLNPLLSACCFTLTILYARLVCLQVLRRLDSSQEAVKRQMDYSSSESPVQFLITQPHLLDSLKHVFNQATVYPSPGKLFPSDKNTTISFSLGSFEESLLDLENSLLARSDSSFSVELMHHRPFRTISSFISLALKIAHQRADPPLILSGSNFEARLRIGENVNNPRMSSRKLIQRIIDESLDTFERAATLKDVDWLSPEPLDVIPDERPLVLWSYFALREAIILEAPLVIEKDELRPFHFSLLLQSTTVARLMKLYSTSNLSLKFCVLDLCALILSRVNDQLRDQESETYGLKLATEYYLIIVKDHNLINALDASLKSETSLTFAPSLLSKATFDFLLQCQIMRRQLRLDASSLASDSFVNELTETIASLRYESALLSVSHIEPSSITLSWDLDSIKEEGVDGSIFHYSLHSSSVSGAVGSLVLDFLENKGRFKIERLFPSCLYNVSIRRSFYAEAATTVSNIERRIKESMSSMENVLAAGEADDRLVASTICATEAELLFTLDSLWLPNNLRLNGTSTVKNVINKKWSTVRGHTRMVNGVFQWDVLIDRCISKNIFIGVVTPEARRDNYVGCDKHGWAFLANRYDTFIVKLATTYRFMLFRAIWHNKSKVKAYGELFRSGALNLLMLTLSSPRNQCIVKLGDIVSVSLDLDKGSLSFKLNSVDLGVAVVGLVGPLYAAFSLYNEGTRF